MNHLPKVENCPWVMAGNFSRTKRVRTSQKGEWNCHCINAKTLPKDKGEAASDIQGHIHCAADASRFGRAPYASNRNITTM